MQEFYITKKDIKKAFTGASDYLINKHFQECKGYCVKKGIPLFDNRTVPTKAFCEYLKLDCKDFIKKIKEKEEIK